MNVCNSKNVRWEKIDALKGIAIFLVVLGHAIIYYPINLHENAICNFIFVWLSSVHMPLFFLISGFCYMYKGKYKDYLFKKIKRLAIPYLVFNAIDVVPRCLFPQYVNRSRGILDSIRKIFFEGGEYWFLYVLFFIFLIYPVIDRVTQRSVYRKFGVAIVVLMLNYFLPGVDDLVDRFIYCLFYFVIGVIIRNIFGSKIFEKTYTGWFIVILAIVFVSIWLVLIKLRIPYTEVIIAIIGSITFYLFVQYKPVSFIFSKFGEYSLQLYLLNGFLLVISRTIIVTVFEVSTAFIIISFNMLITFLFSYLFIKYICVRFKFIKFIMGIM